MQMGGWGFIGRCAALAALAAFGAFGTRAAETTIELEGEYPGHLQDVWMTGSTIWWAHTQYLVKTDRQGHVLTKAEVGGHHAGLEIRDGRLYTAVCAFNGEPRGATTPECHVMVGEYDAETLARIEMHVLDINDRAGSFCFLEDGTCLVGCLRHPSLKPSEVKFHHIGKDWKLIKTHVVDVGKRVKLGIEVIRRYGDEVQLFIYGGPVMRLDAKTLEVIGCERSRGGQKGHARDGDGIWIGESEKNGKGAKTWKSRLVRIPAQAEATDDRLVSYPPYPPAIERDETYDVSVRQSGERRDLVVYNHCEKSALPNRTHGGDVNRRFCEFAFAGSPVTVEITVREDVRCYKVFPSARRLKHSFRDGVISVRLDRPAYFGIQLNDSDKTILSVFADAPERPEDVPRKDAPGVFYVKGWVDPSGPDGVRTLAPDVKEVYLAPGSVLNARLQLATPGMKFHGRGMVLDPFSDVFRFDQSLNVKRGLVNVRARDVTVEDVKLVDARTFNFCGFANNVTYRNVKALASMMCSDGITSGGRNLLVENAWLYVGDNALVVSGVNGGTYRDVAIGTSCAAIFPQSSNGGVRMEDISVFRADDGLINNFHNGVLRRGNKWNEMNGGLQKKEPGPQDLSPQTDDFDFRRLSAVDCTLFSHFFSGRNMGTLPKRFALTDVALPASTGRSEWNSVGTRGGVTLRVVNDPKKYLITDNYAFAFTNLWIEGARTTALPAGAFGAKPDELALSFASTGAPSVLPVAPDRVEVGWTCPPGRKLPPPAVGENLLEDRAATRSIWQRCPSWLVKFDATRRDERGHVVYRLFQCERKAGIQAVVTERVKASGFGRYRLTFEAKARSANAFGLRIQAVSNERTTESPIAEIERDGDWKRYEADLDIGFDPKVCDLVSVFLATTATADEVLFRDFDLRRSR